jgi:putative membrane protein
MFRPLVRTALVLALLAWFFPSISFSNWITLAIASIVVTILFSLIRPILKLVFLPINVVTMGFFSTVINVVLLWLATYLVPGFTIEPTIFFGVALNSFFTLLLISVLITFFQGLVKLIL